ncbi:hypothetical protein GZH47_15690 [Paenibacillus rhizovicinus]|uniref:Uncharacterized protein n=1 Tax=Paenibacillus rhizovicinus TaxID=2704463 RepID=A0A6C0P0X2_9BACL|nr:hypothetical protein [Paenibacillus rhizovicinus]QHW32109.1 hypothetical protein GZH47_15690 [Paenibacillus rhizovicinus]
MKTWKRGTLVLFIATMAAVAGCSSSGSPKEALMDAITKTSKAKSFTYQGTFTINDIQLPQAPDTDSAQNAMLRMALPILLKGAVIQVHGAVQQDPQRAELTLNATLGTGDVKLTVNIPIIVTADQIYVKVPQIPGVPIPEKIADRFVVIDAKKLAEEQGGTNPLDGGAPNLGTAAFAALVDSLEEKTYFSEPAAGDVKDVPSGYKADRYVSVGIDGQHSEAALTAIAGKAIPQVIDLLLQNEAVLKSFGLTQERLEDAKKQLTADKMKEQYTIRKAEITGGITDGYLTFESGDLQVDATEPSKGMKMNIHFQLSQDDINKEVKFEAELPKDAVPVDELAP